MSNGTKTIERVKPFVVVENESAKTLNDAAGDVIRSHSSVAAAREVATVETFQEMLEFFTDKLTEIACGYEGLSDAKVEHKGLLLEESMATLEKLKEQHLLDIETAVERAKGDFEYNMKVTKRDLDFDVEGYKKELSDEFELKLDEQIGSIAAEHESIIAELSTVHTTKVAGLNAEIDRLKEFEDKYHEMGALHNGLEEKLVEIAAKHTLYDVKKDSVHNAKVELEVAMKTSDLQSTIIKLRKELIEANAHITALEEQPLNNRKKVFGLF